jgi:type III secretion protein T
MYEIELMQELLMAFSLSLPRLTAMFITLPMLGKKILGGRLVRNAVVYSFCLIIAPVIDFQLEQNPIDKSMLMILLLKEGFVGLLLGFCGSIPFWISESAGFFIDNQRGSTMASSLNPALETQTSPMGLHFTHTLLTLFYATGMLIILLSAIYKSYIAWPPGEFYPKLTILSVDFFVSQLVYLMESFVLISSPVIIAMFMSEFGLALVSRFAPQLNVFFLAMPIKSAVAGFILILYFKYLIDNICTPMFHIVDLFNQAFSIIN